MIIKAKSYFATAFFINSREIVGLPLSLVIVGLVFYVMLGFNPGIQKHKALAHDMHAESNALQQRSAPQPVLRSSWLQLVMFGLVFLFVMFGLEPDIHGHRARPHDMHAESNALQQRSAPQPVLRSSWLQLARFNKDSYRCRCCGQAGYSLQDNEKNAVLFHKSRRVFKVNKVYQTFRP